MTSTTGVPPLTFGPLGESTFARLRRILLRDPMALVGIAIIVLTIVLALFGQWIAPYPEQGLGSPRPSMRGLAPSAEFLLGTDQLGRDVLSRIIMGTRPALVISVFVVVLAMLIGIPLGAVAGYRGGWIDQVLMRITEIFQSFPPLLLAMITVAILGPSLFNAGLALAISWWPW
ncbi:MAG: ABC transporter permease, partial [Rhodoglobus sp.]|nr:ABC transporter permease [Rhodoglobus sp.]